MSGSQVTIEGVRRVAELANLELTAVEEPRMQRDLNAVLGYVEQLNELDMETFLRWLRSERYWAVRWIRSGGLCGPIL